MYVKIVKPYRQYHLGQIVPAEELGGRGIAEALIESRRAVFSKPPVRKKKKEADKKQ